MAQEFDYPKTETELRQLLDRMYELAREAKDRNEMPCFKGLLEIMRSETVILTAIHRLKGNKGSKTPGCDDEVMPNILQSQYPEVIQRVQEAMGNYQPKPVRRKWIPKPGKEEMRPLGIPAIIDRVVQECVRTVIEPILEAQFFAHSYGFRPMRDTEMALARVGFINHTVGYHWVIEGDISKFFDNVNHTILIKKLWHMGIRDRRVLMLIKQMLKAGIMDEIKVNPIGTPQGGVISPLLANAYLHTLDEWITREWEQKNTRINYERHDNRIMALRKRSNLKPAYLVRYADDWVLITDTKSNAEKWKRRIARYLDTNLKLHLSEDKTQVTNMRKRPIHFLGFDMKLVRGKSRVGHVTRSRPNKERLKAKAKEIYTNLRTLRRTPSEHVRMQKINLINSQIRGIIQYYRIASWAYIDLAKYAWPLSYTAHKALKKWGGGDWVPANQVYNLKSVHSKYTTQLPTIKVSEYVVGITNLSFVNFTEPRRKSQDETPYSERGRELYSWRTGKKPLATRADELLDSHLARYIMRGQTQPRYNFEYFLNRAYAFNRDKGKCRVCGWIISSWDLHIHHVNPRLPLTEVNKLPNLATVHDQCHHRIHDGIDYSELGTEMWNKILSFREKLA